MANLFQDREQLELFARDGWRCQQCRLSGVYVPGIGYLTANGTVLSIDHIVPISKGGWTEDWDNLRTLCMDCNGRKGVKPAAPPRPRSPGTLTHVGELVAHYLDRYREHRRLHYRSRQWEWRLEYILEPAVTETAETGSRATP